MITLQWYLRLIGGFVSLDFMDQLGMIHPTLKFTKYFFSELKNSKNCFVDAGLNLLGTGLSTNPKK